MPVCTQTQSENNSNSRCFSPPSLLNEFVSPSSSPTVLPLFVSKEPMGEQEEEEEATTTRRNNCCLGKTFDTHTALFQMKSFISKCILPRVAFETTRFLLLRRIIGESRPYVGLCCRLLSPGQFHREMDLWNIGRQQISLACSLLHW